MDKRYQVFVSSTYSDLKDERAEVIRTLLNIDCIPSGMELFPAADEEQFKYIKRVMDDCDYYLLIIAGRYGTLSQSGISYTELEYDYAVESDLTIIALVHEHPEKIPNEHTESSPKLRKKLKKFRKKVCKNRIVRFWEKKEDLPGAVAISVPAAIKRYPSTGWVRSNMVSSEQSQERLLELEQENLQLRSELREYSQGLKGSMEELSQGSDLYKIEYSYELTHKGGTAKTTVSDVMELPWDEIFAAISPSLFGLSNNQAIKKTLERFVFKEVINSIIKEHGDDVTTSSVDIEDESISAILIQFRALGYITFDGSKWRLTKIGDQKHMELRTIKSDR